MLQRLLREDAIPSASLRALTDIPTWTRPTPALIATAEALLDAELKKHRKTAADVFLKAGARKLVEEGHDIGGCGLCNFILTGSLTNNRGEY